MNILLMRHGNTFAPGQKVVMVGGANDLPLVERGWEQADACRAAMNRTSIVPLAVFAGPLLRTRTYAERIAEASGVPVKVEECLRELDYGPWTGLSDDEIVRRGDKASLLAWREEGVWPAAFTPTRSVLLAQLRAWTTELSTQYPSARWIGVVTSAGVLRGFLDMDSSTFEQKRQERRLGFKTGHMGVLEIASGGRMTLRAWDVSPDAFEPPTSV